MIVCVLCDRRMDVKLPRYDCNKCGRNNLCRKCLKSHRCVEAVIK